jgi:hypothetical protein
MSGDDDKRPVPNKVSSDEELTEPEVPTELLTCPPVPAGLGDGWFLVRPPLLFFARILTDAEAKELHWTIYPRPDSPEFKPTMDYEATILKLVVRNNGNEIFSTEKGIDFKLQVQTYEDLNRRKEPYNYNAQTTAANRLTKDNPITKALSMDYKRFTIPPGTDLELISYFTNYAATKDLLPEMIFRVYAGDWPMWPTVPLSPPPGVKVPAEGLVKVYLYRPDKGDQNYNPPLPIRLERDIRFEAVNEWGDKVEFGSEHPLEVGPDKDVGFVRIMAKVGGDDGLIAAGAIDKASYFGRDIMSVTNPFPTWDPRHGPPEGPYNVGRARRRWLLTTGAQRPLVAAEGETFAVAVEDNLWVFDGKGELLGTYDAPWYPYSLCLGKGARSAYMGHDNTLVEFDLERGKGYDLKALPDRIENLALRSDGTLMALSDSGLLMHVDTEGRILWEKQTVGNTRVLCARDADVVVVWNGYAKFQVFDGDGEELASNESKEENYDGIAISPNGKLVAVGNHDYKALVMDLTKDLEPVTSFPTIGHGHALAFHPTRPILIVATRNSYLHAGHLEKGPFFTKRFEGYVANDMAFGDKACILSTVDGYIHAFEFEED